MNEQPDHRHELQAEKIDHLVGLIMKYKRNCISAPERQELDEWVVANDANLHLFEELTDEISMKDALAWISTASTSQALKKLKGQLHFERPSRRFSILTLLLHCAIAASIVMLLTLSLLLIDKE
jgi:hypothetical protein